MNREFLKKIIVTGMATLVITNMYYIPASAKWINDKNNNWNWTENGVKTIGWKEINQKWYYFNSDGIMNTGWLNYNGNWYNLSNNGEMNTGWTEINGKWYHFNADGGMSTGWIKDNDIWYYTNFNGEMETGTIGIDGKVYNFSDDGELLNDDKSTEKTQNESENSNDIKNNSESLIAYVSTNSDSLNVRSDANTSSNIIATIPKGTKINIIDDEKNQFYPVIINGKKGWVSSKWISFEKDNDSTYSNTDSDSSDNENLNTPTTDAVSDSNNSDLKDASLGVIRDKQPSTDDKHYYSDDNPFYKAKLSPPFSSGGKLIKGNCTWYAWGRAWEVTGIKPDAAGFIGNAYEWWAANKKSGKYQYGSQPRVGAIAVWKSDLPGSGGSGHVAIVEKIDNGKVYISESTWHGGAFGYKEIYETGYLYGYIYLDKPNY